MRGSTNRVQEVYFCIVVPRMRDFVSPYLRKCNNCCCNHRAVKQHTG